MSIQIYYQEEVLKIKQLPPSYFELVKYILKCFNGKIKEEFEL